MARQRVPIAKLDDTKFVTVLGLDISELLATGVLGLLMPLLALGAKVPLLLKLLLVAGPPAIVFLLFFVRRERLNIAEWLGKLLPYLTRQRSFTASRRSIRPNPALELLDRSASAGTNLVSWEWRTADDGVRELHLFEEPLRPYRAYIARTATLTLRVEGDDEFVVAAPLRRLPTRVELP